MELYQNADFCLVLDEMLLEIFVKIAKYEPWTTSPMGRNTCWSALYFVRQVSRKFRDVVTSCMKLYRPEMPLPIISYNMLTAGTESKISAAAIDNGVKFTRADMAIFMINDRSGKIVRRISNSIGWARGEAEMAIQSNNSAAFDMMIADKKLFDASEKYAALPFANPEHDSCNVMILGLFAMDMQRMEFLQKICDYAAENTCCRMCWGCKWTDVAIECSWTLLISGMWSAEQFVDTWEHDDDAIDLIFARIDDDQSYWMARQTYGHDVGYIIDECRQLLL